MSKKAEVPSIDYDHATFVYEDTVKHGKTEIKRKYYSVVDYELYAKMLEDASKVPDERKYIPKPNEKFQTRPIAKEEDEKLIVEGDEIVSVVYLHIPPK